MKSTLYGLAIAIAFTALPAFATAEKAAEPSTTRSVNTADLDLSMRNGRVVLDSRIRSAAREICEDLNGALNAVVSECVVRSIRNAQKQRDDRIAHHLRLADAQHRASASPRPIA